MRAFLRQTLCNIIWTQIDCWVLADIASGRGGGEEFVCIQMGSALLQRITGTPWMQRGLILHSFPTSCPDMSLVDAMGVPREREVPGVLFTFIPSNLTIWSTARQSLSIFTTIDSNLITNTVERYRFWVTVQHELLRKFLGWRVCPTEFSKWIRRGNSARRLNETCTGVQSAVVRLWNFF